MHPRARRFPFYSVLAGMFLAGVALSRGTEARGRCVVTAQIEGVISAATHAYLDDAVERTQAQGCEALLVRIDTPGGHLEPTRDIAQLFLGSRIPIVTYVAPEGVRAGSAGMFIALAAHVAAMAPGSNIGAAHPVMAGGGEVDPEVARKLTNDTAALARAIAERRGRNVAWAERAVRESESVTAAEALELKVIDLVAPSTAALLTALDGRSVEVAGGARELATREARLEPAEMTIQQRLLSTLGHPSVISVLVMIGTLAVVLELSSPGVGVPAAIGVLAFVLAAVGLNAIPVNLAGIALILASIALFIAEVFVTSFGLLSLLGLGLLLLGAALLMDRTQPNFFADPSVSVSWSLVVPTASLLALGVIALGVRARKVRARPFWGGDEELLGAEGLALTEVDAEHGQVQVRGEIWQARSSSSIPPGSRVRVEKRQGLMLAVRSA